eukprot:scaffold3660_cov246-Chaetoceros_neogracile.AAC.2
MIFVLLLDSFAVVFEYSQDLIAKKNARQVSWAIAIPNGPTALLWTSRRMLIGAAFCCFTPGSKFL